jgi:four helix bundle protein
MKCKNLDIWKRLSKICSEIYLYFKEYKDYDFKDQITRSALSVPSNIAEGVEKISDKDTIKFLDIARGSIAEVQTQIYIGMKIKYIESKIGNVWINEYDEISKMITSFINSLKRSLNEK